MKVSISCDHGALELKNYLIENLKNQYEIIDRGTYTKDSVDYPMFNKLTAIDVRDSAVDLGIVLCTNGVGASIVANKIKGIRAALCLNKDMAEHARLHNNANVLSMGQSNQTFEEALEIAKIFLSTDFSNVERHARRVEQIIELEK